jgi:hypothetical protein
MCCIVGGEHHRRVIYTHTSTNNASDSRKGIPEKLIDKGYIQIFYTSGFKTISGIVFITKVFKHKSAKPDTGHA